MKMKYTVYMDSEDYGSEVFGVHALSTAAAGQALRLVQSAAKYARKDGVVRNIIIEVRPDHDGIMDLTEHN